MFLLEKMDAKFGDREFRLFEAWLGRVSSWADHDGLVHYLIAPTVAAHPARVKDVFRWAKSRDRWHRRAACVALIRGARAKMFFPEIVKLSNSLLADEDARREGWWLLRETAKFDAKRTVPYLMTIRGRAPRLVLRTACETLPAATRYKPNVWRTSVTAQSRLLTDISHELRSPLARLNVALELARQRSGPDAVAPLIASIARLTGSMS